MITQKIEFYTDVQVVGNSIYYRGVSNGREIKSRIPWHPTLFLPTKGQVPSSEWKTIDGTSVTPTQLGGIRETRDFIRNYEDVAGFVVYGNARLEYNYIAETFPQEVIEWDIKHIRIFDLDIEVISESGFPDPQKADYPIVSITIKSSTESVYSVWGLKEFDSNDFTIECADGTKEKIDVEYTQFDSETLLLMDLVDYWKTNTPHIITGWNVQTFDMPYIINRIRKVLGESWVEKLSVWGMVKEKDSWFMNRAYKVYNIVGTTILDYLELYWKFATKQSESWKLDYICFEELGERKLSYEEYSNLPTLYKQNHQKFISYNIRDVWLVEKLDLKKKLLFLAIGLAYDSHCNFDDVYAQVTMWDQIIHCHLLRKKIVIPPKKDNSKKEQYEGAYVKDPKPGRYDWVSSWDLDSLYPHLIMQYNISPDTIVEPENYTLEMRKLLASGVTVDKFLKQELDLGFLQKQNVTITPNGQFFRTNKHGFLAEIMDSMYQDRLKYKKMMLAGKKELETTHDPIRKAKLVNYVSRYDTLQNVKKICLNSAYGALGNEYFRFFDVRQAEGVTMAGQLSIRWIANSLNQYLNSTLKTTDVDYVIASDTDSVYLHMERLVDLVYGETKPDKKVVIAMMDKFCKSRISPCIEKNAKELAFYANAYEQKMSMKRESLADKGIWTAPKRYILNVYDKEGVVYEKPKIIITGLEAIKSNTPAVCRVGMKKAIEVMLNGNEDALHSFVKDFRKEFNKAPIEDISFPTSVKGLIKYADKNSVYGKGAPVHVKACLFYNAKLKELKLHNKYALIPDGEKVKFIHLKKNNPIGNETIGFIDIIPPEFDLESYYDKNTQFQKAFIEKLAIITNCIGWSVEKQARLDI